jgi:hypothetical protein
MAQKESPSWATTAQNVTNGDPNLADPGASLKQFGWNIVKPLVQHMNWLLNLISFFVKANNEIKIAASTYEATVGETVLINNLSANSTGLLPALPYDRQTVSFGGVGSFLTYSVTINGNGNNIMEAGVTDLVLDIENRVFQFVWDNSSSLWKFSVANLQGAV